MSDLGSAIRMLDVNDFELVVLDTYAAWSAVCSGMLPILASIFPTLAVPRSVVDQLLELHSEFDTAHDTDRMSLWWADGQFYRDTFTPEQLKAQPLNIWSIETSKLQLTQDSEKVLNGFLHMLSHVEDLERRMLEDPAENGNIINMLKKNGLPLSLHGVPFLVFAK